MEYSVWHVLDFVHDIVLASYEAYFKVDVFFLHVLNHLLQRITSGT